MRRRTLFRSLGLAALVAGVSALPKFPQDPKAIVPEGGPAFTKEKSEPLPEKMPYTITTPWVYGGIPAGGAIWQNPYPVSWGGNWTTSGANHMTITASGGSIAQYMIPHTAGAIPFTSGFVQAAT